MHLVEGKIHNWKYILIALEKSICKVFFMLFCIGRQGDWYWPSGYLELIRPSLYNK